MSNSPNMSRIGMIQFLFYNPACFSMERNSPLRSAVKFMFTKPAPNDPALGTSTFSGKTVLITGASSGVGLAAAKKLGAYGAKLIVTTREGKGERTCEEIRKTVEGVEVSSIDLDMASWESIKRFREAVKDLEIHYAIMNAGAYHENYHISKETGFEITTQVHILSNVLISLILLPILARSSEGSSGPSRLLIISSEAHAWVRVPKKGATAAEALKNMNDPKSTGWDRYHFSKLFVNLWAQELHGRYDKKKVQIASATPGYVKETGLFAGASGNPLTVLLEWLCGRTPEEGTRTYIHALEAEKFGGKYFADGRANRPFWYCESEEGARLQKELFVETVGIVKGVVPDVPTEGLE